MMRRAGFTLIELSIVLVILGLLVGGVLTGQSLIRAAELRSVTTDLSKYQTAINAFKEKYLYLPGDLPNATSFWGAANSNNTTCLTTVRSGTQTCNGDGNGLIWGWGNDPRSYEQAMFWEHLSLAGMIEGSYLGYTTGLDANGANVLMGVTAPRGKISGSGFTVIGGNSDGYVNARPEIWGSPYKHTLLFAKWGSNPQWYFYSDGPILSAEEAYSLDSKTDDGKPGTGTIRTNQYGISAGTCTDTVTRSAYATATYVLTTQGASCKLQFDLGV